MVNHKRIGGKNMRLDIILENALVVDGSGGKPYPADVGIQGNAIVAIGDLSGMFSGTQWDPIWTIWIRRVCC